MNQCSYPGCGYTRNNPASEKRSLHRIPVCQAPDVGKVLRIDYAHLMFFELCSAHFKEGAIVYSSNHRATVRKDVPFSQLIKPPDPAPDDAASSSSEEDELMNTSSSSQDASCPRQSRRKTVFISPGKYQVDPLT